jgi:trk system potassium uptake protein TrkH
MLNILAKTFGLVLLTFGISLLAPMGLAFFLDDGTVNIYAGMTGSAFALCLFVFFIASRMPGRQPQLRDGFLIVTLTWVGLSVFGALPFILIGELDPASAIFETASGYTTTGSTAITDLDALPQSLLFYRQEIQWIGGIGVIVLAVALIPMLGIGGMQVLNAETTGPIKGDKLQPRLEHTVQAIWRIYVGITIACAAGFWLAGMSVLDAINHSFATVSTGGYSTYDDSFAYFNSWAIEAVACVFMVVGSLSFMVHGRALAQRSPQPYLGDVETKTFLAIIAVASLFIATVLWRNSDYSWLMSFRLALFEVTSVISTTGFAVSDFSVWPLMLPPLIIFIGFIGGCTGSTSGGVKVLRVVIMARQTGIELARLIHPRIVRTLKLSGDVISDDVVRSVWAFFGVYLIVFVILMLAVMAFGLDQVSAFGAIAATINNVGPGLGEVAVHFGTVGSEVKLICALACIIGRLEVFTVFVLCTPAYWREQLR